MGRRILRSVLDEDADLFYQNRGNKPAKSENFVPAYVASSSRRLVIRVSLVLVANLLMLDSGKFLARVSTSRTLVIS